MSGSRVKSVAHRIGSAAFFAPEIGTSPSSLTPPSMISLSTRLRLPLFGRHRLNGKRVDVFAHALAKRRVHELVLAHFRKPAELRAHDDGFEMASVARHFDVVALEAFFEPLPNKIRIHGKPLMTELVARADKPEREQ